MTADAARELTKEGRKNCIAVVKDGVLAHIRKQAESGYSQYTFDPGPDWVREPVVEMLKILEYEVETRVSARSDRAILVTVRW